MTSSSGLNKLFKYRHFDCQIIILCVRWYVSYKLSYRDLVEMMAERGVEFAHTTVLRWVQRFMPEFEKRWMRFARPVGKSWRVDETYILIRGQWSYLYRAVDKRGRTVDFRLSEHRDIEAAKAFFRKALLRSRAPMKVTLDGHWPSHRALFELRREARIWHRVKVRTCPYLNNIVEQDHRAIKARTGPMLGFKVFANAARTIARIELIHRIRKGQFRLIRKRGPTPRLPMSVARDIALA
jgi:transposase-like protein